MPDQTMVKNIKVVKNNTRPVQDTFFPNIEYLEQDLFTIGTEGDKKRYTKISSHIPIIRGDVYLILLVQKYEDSVQIPSRKKEYIQRFLQNANAIQQQYIVQDSLMTVQAFNREQLIYKMEY